MQVRVHKNRKIEGLAYYQAQIGRSRELDIISHKKLKGNRGQGVER